MNDKQMTFIQKIIAIQMELKVPKNQFNKFGNYKYRSLEDILEALKPLLAKYELFAYFSEKTVIDSGKVVLVSTINITDGKDSFSVDGDAGVEENKKGMALAQSYGSSSSYAKKYACGNLFLIDDGVDDDSTNTHGKSPASNLASKDPKKVCPYGKNKGKEWSSLGLEDMLDIEREAGQDENLPDEKKEKLFSLMKPHMDKLTEEVV